MRRPRSRPSTKVVLVGVLLVALALAGIVSRFADANPDGLTKVSEDHGFAGTGRTHQGFFDGYGSLTGVIGVLVVLALAGGVTYVVRRRSRDDRS
ncbi:hypothetical protein GCM10009795_039630 [Nocardioides hankookensis]|uniref:PDGLE domain-containing protein n=1 Tax=Nocardioides hankookensis TaxID=443157 RepID=A0ABW1LPH7_9ACTN